MPDVIEILQALPHAVTPEQAGPDVAAADVARGHRALGQRRRRRLASVAGTAAAGTAVVLAATSALSTARPAMSAGPASQVHAASYRLTALAARITADGGPLPGNASLVVRTEISGGVPPQVSYNLYTDGGGYYVGGDKKSLMEAVSRHENEAGGIDAREVAAARYAVAGDLTAARERMVKASPNYLGLGLSPAARKRVWDQARAKYGEIYKEKGINFPPSPPVGELLQEDADNYVWNNGIGALSAGGGDPRVRAGVLRLLSTISGVTVANSTIGGQPMLTLTAGPEVFGGSGRQMLTINASTGMPVKSVMPAQGNEPSSVDTFRVTRVTLADIEVGRF